MTKINNEQNPLTVTSAASNTSDNSFKMSGAAVLVAIQLELLEIFMKNAQVMNKISATGNTIALNAAKTAAEATLEAGKKEAEQVKFQAYALIAQAVTSAVQVAVSAFGMWQAKQKTGSAVEDNNKIETNIRKINSPAQLTATEGQAPTTSTPTEPSVLRRRMANGHLDEITDQDDAAIKADEGLKREVLEHLRKRKSDNEYTISRDGEDIKRNLDVFAKVAELGDKVTEAVLKLNESQLVAEKAEWESLKTLMQAIIDILRSSGNQALENRSDLLQKVQQIFDLLEKVDNTNHFVR